MSKIKLSRGFVRIPEGTQVLKITKVDYKAATGKMEITMETQDELTHIERFALLKSKDEANEKAMSAFSYLARVAMNNMDLDEIDHTDLIGRFIECDVRYEEYDKPDGSGKGIAVRLDNKRPSAGWETSASASNPVSVPTDASGKVDLKALFGM